MRKILLAGIDLRLAGRTNEVLIPLGYAVGLTLLLEMNIKTIL